jgi:glucose-6-phosphate isomerase
MLNSRESGLLKKLEAQYYLKRDDSISQLFKDNKNRFGDFSIEFENLLFDYSKNLVDEDIIPLLVLLAEKCKLRIWISKLFNGAIINHTEKRAVLHTALRNKSNVPIKFNNENITTKINKVLEQMSDFCTRVHNGEFTGATGKKINTIVNIGIGGSHLGPEMVCNALKPYAIQGMRAYFVSNIDSADILHVIEEIDLETTLFVIASKSFTTQETMKNAETAKSIFIEKLGNKGIHKHFIAVSTNIDACKEFGIDEQNIFAFWNWVGGRYSLWSSIGISIALYIGFENFDLLLEGAYKMDEHFRTTPFMENIPVIMGLLDVWYINFFKTRARAVIPYDNNLRLFPAYLQQLEMESNGKSINREGKKVDNSTGQIIWGEPGTNSQHSFFQFLHQGTQCVPVDFIGACKPHYDAPDHHDILISNMIAQGEALMKGKNETQALKELEEKDMDFDEVVKLLPYKVFPGNRPTTSILLDKLTPKTLGSLIAMYEHKVFVQGIIWNINSFDQWGVELGKQLSQEILKELDNNNEVDTHDSSTNGLLNFYLKNR